MRVKDRDTGVIYSSDNKQVIEQWLKYPDKYIQPKKKVKSKPPKNRK